VAGQDRAARRLRGLVDNQDQDPNPGLAQLREGASG
jgi:hypothetical protein